MAPLRAVSDEAGGGALARSAAFLRAMAAASRRSDLLLTGLLVPLGFLVEGAGILLLIPILGLVLGTGEVGDASARIVEALIGWTGAAGLADRLLILLGLFALLMLARALIVTARDRVLARLQVHFIERIRVDALSDVASAPWHRLARIRHGRVMALLSGDIQACGAAAHHAVQSAVSAFLVIAYLALTFLVSPELALFSLVVIGAIGAGLVPLVRSAMTTGGAMSRANLAMADALSQLLGGLKLAKSLGGTDAYLARLRADQKDLSDAQIFYMVRQSRAKVALTTGIALAAALLVYAGFVWFDLGAPAVAALLLLLSRLGGPALQVQQGLHALAASVPAFERLSDLRAEVKEGPAPVPAQAAAALPARATLHAERIGFAHDAGPPILSGLSFDIAPGTFVGLGGASGAGKSTLADILAGLLLPTEGALRLGETVLTPDRLPAWRARIAYVPQDSYLLNDSVRANLAWGRDGLDDTRMWAALEAVGIAGRVREMGGLGGIAGERGSFLSGGERQRIGIARALLRRPELIVLDEATSALDAASEQAVLAAIRAIDPRPAALIISHSPDVLSACALVLRLERGQLFEAVESPSARG